MESTGQFDVYAAFYDLLYKDKNYKAESEYIDRLIDRFSKQKKTKPKFVGPCLWYWKAFAGIVRERILNLIRKRHIKIND